MSFDPNSPNPYAASSTQPTTPKKSNTLMYVLLGVGGILLLSCAGCIGLMYFGANAAFKMVGTKVKPQLQADPVVQQHIGTLSKVDLSIPAFVTEFEKNKSKHSGRDICFKVEGDKGKGLIMCRIDQSDPNNPRVVNAELCMENGEYHKLTE